ncbi:MAG: hypothetical protein HYZ32_01805 [Hydrocarboniphaga effusa]|nr:hypothetical protein [Hydrocarboniphaga effusa]
MKRAAILSRFRRKQPMEVMLTFKMNFGDRPEDALTLIKNQRVPLVGSVFENRDRIARGLVHLLIKAGAKQPRVWNAMRTLKHRLRGE